jgi:hypothetical protein
MLSNIEHARISSDGVRLLAKCIDESGLTQHDFSIAVLMRDPRTVRRWLSGERPMPALVTKCLKGLAECEGGIRGAIRQGVRISLRPGSS